MRIERSGVFWKLFGLLALIASGGVGFYHQQSEIGRLRETTSSLKKEREEDRLNWQESAKTQAGKIRVLEQGQEDANAELDESNAANKDLSDRLGQSDQTIFEMQNSLDELNRKLGTTIGMEQVSKMIAKVGPATVSLSYPYQGDEVLWSGALVKIGNTRGLLTCGHAHNDAFHWARQKFTVRMFDGRTFDMTPRPLSSGYYAYLPSNRGDLAFTELPPEEDAQMTDENFLEIEPATNLPEYGEPILFMGNPMGQNASASFAFVSHPGRFVYLRDSGVLRDQTQLLGPLDGGNSGGPGISLKTGRLKLMAHWVRRGYVTHGYCSHNGNIKDILHNTFGLDAMSPEETFNVELIKFAQKQFPTPFNPIPGLPLGNLMPISNDPARGAGQMIHKDVIDGLEDFMMPNPLMRFPILKPLGLFKPTDKSKTKVTHKEPDPDSKKENIRASHRRFDPDSTKSKIQSRRDFVAHGDRETQRRMRLVKK